MKYLLFLMALTSNVFANDGEINGKLVKVAHYNSTMLCKNIDVATIAVGSDTYFYVGIENKPLLQKFHDKIGNIVTVFYINNEVTLFGWCDEEKIAKDIK